MKAVSAVLLTGQLTPEPTAAAWLIIGAVLLVLAPGHPPHVRKAWREGTLPHGTHTRKPDSRP